MTNIDASCPEFIQSSKVDVSSRSTSDVQLAYVTAEQWDTLATEFEDIFHEQTAAFNMARWDGKRCEFVTVTRHGKIIGGAAIVVIPTPVFRTGLAILKWGPIWRKRDAEVNSDHLLLCLQAIRDEFATRRNLFLTVMPRGEFQYSDIAVNHLRALGFTAGKPLPAPTRYLVNTDQTEEELRKSLSQKWRYNLKKSEKNAFEVEFQKPADGLEPFLELYTTMLARKGFNDHSAIYTLRDFIATAPAHFQPRFVFVRHNGKLCASGVVDICGDTAIYLYGATSNEALELRAGYALHWAIVKTLCEDAKVKWYDLGGNDLDKGLHQFKSGFVGKSGELCDCPEIYHFSGSWLGGCLGRSVFAARGFKQSVDKLLRRVKSWPKR
ncbi:MAG: peptidoglycan bridge formation glycyltransferase FemA/FemB family protein [Pseudomonadota bacterium]